MVSPLFLGVESFFGTIFMYVQGDLSAGPLFWWTLNLSMLTASFGVAKFLKSGPSRIVMSEKCMDGFGTLTYILIVFNIFTTLVGRGWVTGNVLFRIALSGSKQGYLLILLNFAPQIGLTIFYQLLQLLVKQFFTCIKSKNKFY